MSTQATSKSVIKRIVRRTFGKYLSFAYSLYYEGPQYPGKFLVNLRRMFRPTRKEYRWLDKMNLRQWLLYEHNQIELTNKCCWMGIPAVKNPLDAWVYQEIVHMVKPDVIVEIGSRAGGTTLFLAQLLDLLGNGIVISVDIDRTLFHAEHERIVTITGDSSAPQVVAQVSALCQGKSTLVLQDGDHSKEAVLKDLRAYSKLVSVNSYFIVEDSIIDLFRPGDGIGDYEAGPLLAIEEFLAQTPGFVVDHERERYILTSNPSGFLKRIL